MEAYVIKTWGLGGPSRYAEVWRESIDGAVTLLYRTRGYGEGDAGANAAAAQADARAWVAAHAF